MTPGSSTALTDLSSHEDGPAVMPIEVPANRYWGAQTQRSLGNFKIGGERMPVPLVHALGIVKKCAAETNAALGQLDKSIADVIVAAAQEVIDGKLDDEFPWLSGKPGRAPKAT